MTPKKSLEDILAEYTEDLMAERKPRLVEDIGALDEGERKQLSAMLPIVRQLKAAHREPPPPREEFIQQLDAFMREEVARQVATESQIGQPHLASPGEIRAASDPLPHHGSLLDRGRKVFRSVAVPGLGVRWRFVGVAILVLVLGLQVQLYLQVRRLERQNQALVARLEQLGPSGSLVPLALPRGLQGIREKEVGTPGSLSWDDLFTGVELRVRVDQRIRELEKEAANKTGRDRQEADALLKELRALLRPSPKP